LVAMGCIMVRQCHSNTCPVGVCTQDLNLRKKFTGTPEKVVNLFTFIAQEVREILAQLGFKNLNEIIGRTDLLKQVSLGTSNLDDLDLNPLLVQADPGENKRYCIPNLINKVPPTLDEKIYEDIKNSIAEKYEVRTCEAEHSVPTFSFLLEEKEKPGTFYPEKAISLDVPKGELWHKLQQGEEVVIENKSIKPSEVMGPNVPGKKIGVSGDTRPTKKLEVFFKNCDYQVFDSTYLDELKEKAIQTCHSTAKEAATFAKNANVSNLILTHFSARYKDGNVLLEEAKAVHNSVIAAKDQLKNNIV